MATVQQLTEDERDEAAERDVAATGQSFGATFAIAVMLMLATATAYLPALDAQLLNWDDNIVVSENVHIRGTPWRVLRWAMTTDRAGYPMPLTWLSHALDYRLYGLRPRGHHATSVLLHVVNTALLFGVLWTLTGARWRSALVAALFGLHPLHVEPVVWVTERKEVLCAFFSLLTLAAYARFVRVRTATSAVIVAATFAAALASKPMAMTIPAVLLLLDYWPLGRLSWRSVREKIPLFVLAIVMAVWALVGSAAAGAVKSATLVAPADRIANALVSTVKYLGLALWPTRLSPWYSHPALEGQPLAPGVVAGAAVALAVATFVAVRAARSRPHVTFGWFYYLGTLVPVIGLVQVGGQAMADRFMYVPLTGIFVLVVWEIARLPLWLRREGRAIGVAATAAVLLVLGFLTRQQTRIWHDSNTFWAYVLEVNPRAAVAYYALGGMFADKGRVDEAIAAYRRSLKLRPDYVNAHTELANLLVAKGRFAAAAAHYRKAIAGGQEAEGHNNLGNVLLRLDRPEAARRHLEIAIALRPNFVEAHNNLGIVLANQGHLDEAAEQFRAVLKLRPSFSTASQNLAVILAEQRREKDEGAAAAP